MAYKERKLTPGDVEALYNALGSVPERPKKKPAAKKKPATARKPAAGKKK